MTLTILFPKYVIESEREFICCFNFIMVWSTWVVLRRGGCTLFPLNCTMIYFNHCSFCSVNLKFEMFYDSGILASNLINFATFVLIIFVLICITFVCFAIFYFAFASLKESSFDTLNLRSEKKAASHARSFLHSSNSFVTLKTFFLATFLIYFTTSRYKKMRHKKLQNHF